jgi:hypothetical protein
MARNNENSELKKLGVVFGAGLTLYIPEERLQHLQRHIDAMRRESNTSNGKSPLELAQRLEFLAFIHEGITAETGIEVGMEFAKDPQGELQLKRTDLFHGHHKTDARLGVFREAFGVMYPEDEAHTPIWKELVRFNHEREESVTLRLQGRLPKGGKAKIAK